MMKTSLLHLQALILVALWAINPLSTLTSSAQTSTEDLTKPRVIITCDPELDDQNSLIRFLLHSTDYRVEGLIYASSQFHWKGDGRGTLGYVPGREYSRDGLDFGPMTSYRWSPSERFIDNVVETYAQVYPNLLVHDSTYPTPEHLKSVIRVGNVEFDGDFSHDTPGSELIKRVLLDDEDGPVYIGVWGGASTVARALKSIEDIYSPHEGWEALKARVCRKAVLCLSGDQDDTWARYIHPFWPEIRQMELSSMAVGMAYMVQLTVHPADRYLYLPEWMQENVSSRGPLGALYRVWGDGRTMVPGDRFDFFGFDGKTADELRREGYIVWCPLQPRGSFISEGDTYCYLNLIDNGLRATDDPVFGGWCGGRISLPDSVLSLSQAEQTAFIATHYPLPRFSLPVQNAFAARLLWSVTPTYKDANHEPAIKGPTALTAHAGETLKLKYRVTDPDCDPVTVRWWPYLQACTYPWNPEGQAVVAQQGNIVDSAQPDPIDAYLAQFLCDVLAMTSTDQPVTTITIPTDARPGDTLHLILEATDAGTPALTRYHRVVITVD